MLLRQDSADLRLTARAYAMGLVGDERMAMVERKRHDAADALSLLERTIFTPTQAMLAKMDTLAMQPLGQKMTAAELLRRSEATWE